MMPYDGGFGRLSAVFSVIGRIVGWALWIPIIWCLFLVTGLGENRPHLWLMFAATQTIWGVREWWAFVHADPQAHYMIRAIIHYAAGLIGTLGCVYFDVRGFQAELFLVGALVLFLLYVARWADDCADYR